MKARLLLAGLLIPTLSIAQPSPKAAISAIYSRMTTLIKAKDAKGMATLFKAVALPDFRYYALGGGYIGRDAMERQMVNQASLQGRITRASMVVTGLKQSGRTVVATVSNDYAMTLPSKDGKVHAASSKGVSEDTWVLADGKWRLKKVKVKAEKSLFDGKPINP